MWTHIRIRLYEIDAPESRTKDLDEKARGLASKAYLQTIMDSCGGKFILKSHGVGKFGRCLGTIYVHGENINDRLIQEGYAKRYER
jgi:micrococcal nuclease